MNGNRALLDSNAIIYATKRVIDAERLLSEHDNYFVSIISFIEVYSFAFPNAAEKDIADEIFKNLEIVDLDNTIAEQAIIYRKSLTKKIKLADAVILATAQFLGAALITNNQSDFEKVDPSVSLIGIDAFKAESD